MGDSGDEDALANNTSRGDGGLTSPGVSKSTTIIRPRRRKSKKRRIPRTGAATSRPTGDVTNETTNREPLHDVSLSAAPRHSFSSAVGTMGPGNATGKRRRRTSSGATQPHVPMRNDDDRAEDELNFMDAKIKTDNDVDTTIAAVEPKIAKITTAFDPKLLRSTPGILQAREMGVLSRMVGKKKRRRIQPPLQPQLLDDIWNNGNHSGKWFKTLMLCRPHCTSDTTTAGDGLSDSQHPRRGRRWEWKPSVHRSIPFRALETPPTDAVLALSRDASYTIALGGGAYNASSTTATVGKGRLPILALRFYGVPSPARLPQQQQNQGITVSGERGAPISPLFLTIPLLMDAADSAENQNFTAPTALLGDSLGHAAANTPVRMLFSRDGCIGVAIVLHSTAATEASPALPNAAFAGSPAVEDEDALGTIFAFPLPGITDRFSRREDARVKSLKCSNVRVIGNLRSHSFRNMLWPTRSVPSPASICQDAGSAWCNGFYITNGYLLLNDEDDGYRMTWLVLGRTGASHRRAFHLLSELTVPSMPIKATRSDIFCKPDYAVWENIWSDRFTGCIFTPQSGDVESEEEQIHVKCEAYFSIEALLSDIVARRKKMFASCSSLPDYFYNLISVSDDGRVITLVLVFALGKYGSSNVSGGTKQRQTPAAVGLFLQYNFFNNTYDEMEWVQHPTLSDARFLRNWSNTLALNWQMRENDIGLYSIPRDNYGKRAPLLQNQAAKDIRFHEDDSRGDELDDFDPTVWKSSVKRDEVNSSLPPKDIAMSSLYPFCDVISNKAVIAAEPVMKIGCRNAPIELSYS